MSVEESSGSPRVRWIGTLSVCSLTLSGALLSWFGVQDLFVDASYGVRLRAAVLLGVGLYVTFAAGTLAYAVYVLRSGASTALSIVVSGAILSAVAGSLLTIYQLVDGDLTWWLACWAMMATSGGMLAVWLLRLGARVPYPKRFAVTVLATSLAGAANFGYTALYQPAAQPVQFSLDAKMDKPSVDPSGRIASVPVTVTFRNTGKVAVTVLMTTYSVMGRRTRIVLPGRSPDAMNLATERGRPSARATIVDGYDILQTDQFIFPGTTFEPDAQVAAGRVINVPVPTGYDALGINAWILVLRKADAQIPEDVSTPRIYSWRADPGQVVASAPDWAVRGRQDFALYTIPVRETNYLDRMIRRRWEGAVWRVFGDPAPGRPPGSYISLRFHPAESPIGVGFDTADDDNRRATERYGVVRSETGLLERSTSELGMGSELQFS